MLALRSRWLQQKGGNVLTVARAFQLSGSRLTPRLHERFMPLGTLILEIKPDKHSVKMLRLALVLSKLSIDCAPLLFSLDSDPTNPPPYRDL